jgi:hypothetical protein
MAFWKTAARRAAAFRRLGGGDRALALRAAASISAVAAALLLFPFGRVRRILDARADRAVPRRGGGRDAARLGRIYGAVGRALPWANCLSTSLALSSALREHGMPCRLRFGVRRAEGGLEAHAWLESGTLRLDISPTEDGFVPFEAPIAAFDPAP